MMSYLPSIFWVAILLFCQGAVAWLPCRVTIPTSSSSSRRTHSRSSGFALPAIITRSHNNHNHKDDDQVSKTTTTTTTATSRRRSFLVHTATTASSLLVSSLILLATPAAAQAKCKDIDSCREIGEQKEAENLAANPIVRLGKEGLQYKVLTAGVGDAVVTPGQTVQMAYYIAQANGNYMYSQGFGYNQIDGPGGNTKMADLGLGLTVHLAQTTTDNTQSTTTTNEIPVGIQRAMVGMKRGEKRRISLPPSLGFETSNWNPKPTTFRGERQIISYQDKLYGKGTSQPPFPAPTIWDVEVLSFR